MSNGEDDEAGDAKEEGADWRMLDKFSLRIGLIEKGLTVKTTI